MELRVVEASNYWIAVNCEHLVLKISDVFLLSIWLL